MKGEIAVAFASCSPELAPAFVERFAQIAPELDLYVVSEFPPPVGRWIPYRVDRSFTDNLARCTAALTGKQVRYAAVILQPGVRYRKLQLLALRLAPLRTLFYNENLDHWTLRPRSLPLLGRHVTWRVREGIKFQVRPGGDLYTWLWRLRHPHALRRPLAYAAASIAGQLRLMRTAGKREHVERAVVRERSLSVVVPSRNGKMLLEVLLPLISTRADEIIVVDNGSDDGTAEFLASRYSDVRVLTSAEPLSFARAANLGIAAAASSHVCLLNNDMRPEKDFLSALGRAFEENPDLFCATAQIFFPPGKRREETGKAVMRPVPLPRLTTEFPLHCIEPLPGEDGSWVLYGSGGCSLYSTEKLRELNGFDESYEPAYVEDLDLGVRGWQRGWPTVFVAGARTVHEHRATTSRYYTEEQLAVVLERNYLRFLAQTICSPTIFRKLWRDAIQRLNLRAALEHDTAAAAVLNKAWTFPLHRPQCPSAAIPEEHIFALGSGDVAVFPGRGARGRRTIAVASCYSPFPLSHGGAVRMYNLMRRASADYTQVLITFVDRICTPPPELLDICAEIVLVRRVGSHTRADQGRPDVVAEFDSAAFRAALRQLVRKWRPGVVQLEFTQMAQYAADCAPAKTLLIEHDITLDLYRQLLANTEDWDLRQQLGRWEKFETHAWQQVDCVVTMSGRDQSAVEGAQRTVTLPNGVDLLRYQPSDHEAEPRRLLFIGSFAHLPNLLAVDFFLHNVWPHLAEHRPALHVIAGARHDYFYNRWRDRVSFPLDHPGLELEGFVADVRPAYRRASLVVAPLLASAGTNIKIMEAMAMGKAVVSTSGGVNGLDEIVPWQDAVIENDGRKFAEAIIRLWNDSSLRRTLERNARAAAERAYNWDVIAARQRELYEELFRS